MIFSLQLLQGVPGRISSLKGKNVTRLVFASHAPLSQTVEGLASPHWHLIVSENSGMTSIWKSPPGKHWKRRGRQRPSGFHALGLPIALRFPNELLDKAHPSPASSHQHAHTSSLSGLPSAPSICQACPWLRTFALVVLLLEELFSQTLTCLAPSCPPNPNPNVIFSDHPLKVPSTPHHCLARCPGLFSPELLTL